MHPVLDYSACGRMEQHVTDTELDHMRDHMLTAIRASSGLDALEAVRVEALGKQGRVTALLKTLGGMTPEERQVKGPAINGLREAVSGAIAARIVRSAR